MRSIAMLSVLLLLLACAGTPEPDPSTVNFRAGFGSDSDGLAEAWLGYAMARLMGDSDAGVPGATIDPASLVVEANARESMALIWGELAASMNFENSYLEDLVAIQQAGFVREYTWRCVLGISDAVAFDLNLVEFETWRRRELPHHVVQTFVRVARRDGIVVADVGWEVHKPRNCDI